MTSTIPRIEVATIEPISLDGDVTDMTFRLRMTTRDRVDVEFEIGLIGATLLEMSLQNALRSVAAVAKAKNPELFNKPDPFGSVGE